MKKILRHKGESAIKERQKKKLRMQKMVQRLREMNWERQKSWVREEWRGRKRHTEREKDFPEEKKLHWATETKTWRENDPTVSLLLSLFASPSHFSISPHLPLFPSSFPLSPSDGWALVGSSLSLVFANPTSFLPLSVLNSSLYPHHKLPSLFILASISLSLMFSVLSRCKTSFRRFISLHINYIKKSCNVSQFCCCGFRVISKIMVFKMLLTRKLMSNLWKNTSGLPVSTKKGNDMKIKAFK